MKEVAINWDAKSLSYLGVFFAVFLISLLIDMTANRRKTEITMRNALAWTGIWMLVSFTFAGVTYAFFGQQAASLYISGFFLEKTLAVDNLFAFVAVFASFGLMDKKDQHLQHPILHWGIVGAIVFRGIFLVLLGAILAIPSPWHEWIITVTGAIVLATAWKMWKGQEEEDPDYSQHWSVRFVKKFFPVEPSLADGKFFVRQGKKLAVTIPFLCLVCIEVVDVIFAFDSMPAIAAVVHETPLMITSCLMAVAGLRALYFALVAMKNAFCHLEKAVILMLVYIGAKIILKAWNLIGPAAESTRKPWFDITPEMNLVIIALFIIAGVAGSYIWPEKDEEEVDSSESLN
jgi:tellurite resistance protein TerC